MVIFYGKIHKVLFQERTQESGVGRTRKAQVTELCSRPLRSRRFEIIKKYIAATVNSQEASGAYFY